MNPTVQQQAFIDSLLDTSRNICLRARAGCGKTSSILMAFAAYASKFPQAVIHIAAYNKSIADEVSAKVKALGFTDWKQYGCSTVHSLGWGLVRFAFRLDANAIDDKKVPNLIKARADSRGEGSDIYYTYGKQIASLVSYAKQAGVGFFDDSPIGSADVWYQLADHFDVNGFDDTSVMDSVVTAAQSIYRASLEQTDVIDFDDMVLFPLIKSLKVKFTKDLIFVDEYQDISRARQALIRKFVKPGTGRIIAVGDDKQAIYGFSGAETAALDNFITAHDALCLPLSVTWRCPVEVVKLAQRIVPDLEPAPSAAPGQVLSQLGLFSASEAKETDSNDLLYLESLTPGKNEDVILCRNTAPLIDVAYRLIRTGIPAKVEGRKIGEGLIALVQRWKISSTSQLLDRLQDYQEREVQKANAKGDESKAAEVEDKCETLRQIVQAVNSKGKNRVSDVVEFIESLFQDGAENVVTLATYHRSKGREWNRVILWEHSTRCPSRAAKQQWQREQESNLAYVAITRSRNILVFVN